MKNILIIFSLIFLIAGCQTNQNELDGLRDEQADLEQQLSGEISKSTSLEKKWMKPDKKSNG